MIITIDGPVASGKSSVAKLLAEDLSFYYLYTGLLYRGLSYVLHKNYGYDQEKMKEPNETDIENIFSEKHKFEYKYLDGKAYIFFDGVDITEHLKSEVLDLWSSLISVHRCVREAILGKQKKIGQQHDIVADGRDMGTVVFPDADHKFFLTALPKVRAKRWQKFQSFKGFDYDFQKSLEKVIERDKRDIERELSPLMRAEDAVLVDNSDLSVKETFKLMRSYISP